MRLMRSVLVNEVWFRHIKKRKVGKINTIQAVLFFPQQDKYKTLAFVHFKQVWVLYFCIQAN